MRQRGKRLVLVVCAVLGAAAAGACGGSPASPASGSTTYDIGTAATSITSLPPISEALAEKAIGSTTAANTVIVYSSLTCSHCGNFHVQTFPQLKSKYIDTGSVRYVYRDWERNDTDIRAAMLARCSGDAHYFAVIDVMFRNQAKWAGAANPNQALNDLMRQVGMTQQVIDACLATTALSDAIVQQRAAGTQQYAVSGTPTFVVNGHIIVGDPQGLAPIEAYFH